MSDARQRALARRGELSLAERMRSGRLPALHVAVAAHFGHPEARETGVEPWPGQDSEQARWALAEAGLEPRLAVRIACDLAQRVLERHWQGGPEPARAIALARDWSHEQASSEEALTASRAIGLPGLQTASALCAADAARSVSEAAGKPRQAAQLAARAAVVAAAADGTGIWDAPAGLAFEQPSAEVDRQTEASQAQVEQSLAREHAWQVRHLLRCLLEPDWPDWRSTE